ncbi:(4S)-4-hydroxy-5-phosphonooxypentane-2,3-dione isomerase [Microdochium nivale]|nr:(4S)-4-hydroxy-5-phosphonooxypentane-2,3-dione isomerase [Microdochium nivale]
MSDQLALTAVMTLKPGKEERFLELFKACADYTAKNEPFVLVYELSQAGNKQGGNLTDVVIREVYENQAGFDKHMAGAPVKALIEALSKEGLAQSTKIFWQQPPKLGFSSRL